MNSISFRFARSTVRLLYDPIAEETINDLFGSFQPDEEAEAEHEISINWEPENNVYVISSDETTYSIKATLAEFAERLLTIVTECFVKASGGGPVLNAAAVASGDKVIIIPGSLGTGKSLLASWFISQDYQYLTDGVVQFTADVTTLDWMVRPLNICSNNSKIVKSLLSHKNYKVIKGCTTDLFFLAEQQCDDLNKEKKPSLILLPNFSMGQVFSLRVIPPARSALKLMSSVLNSKALPIHGVPQISKIARNVPTLELCYGSMDQLERLGSKLLPFLLNGAFSPADVEALFAPFESWEIRSREIKIVPKDNENLEIEGSNKPGISEFPAQVLEATPPSENKKKLTIGMATFDDYDGVYFTAQSIRMYHPELTADTEIIVIDNNPTGPCSKALKDLEESISGYRYVPYCGQSGTAVRDQIFRQANADYVMSIDCHVLIVPGALKKLIDYIDKASLKNKDLLQGPLVNDDLKTLSTHFKPEWRAGMYGTWEHDKRGDDPDGPPFEIPMQGLGLFVCRKDAWVGFNPRFRGFGGEEGYIHEKFRQNGGRTLCLPFLRWVHRFARPIGVPYEVQWKDRIYNYSVGMGELGLDASMMKDHFSTHIGASVAADLFAEIEAEMCSPFTYFDAIYCITMDTSAPRWLAMVSRLELLEINHRVRVFNAIPTPENHHIGRTLSHRAIIAEAQQQHLQNVLVLEDDVLFLDETISHLTKSIEEITNQDWHLFYLGGHLLGQDHPMVEGCVGLRAPSGLRGTHGIAYNSSFFYKMLDDLPDTLDSMTKWVKQENTLNQYLTMQEKIFLAHPVVTTQEELISQK